MSVACAGLAWRKRPRLTASTILPIVQSLLDVPGSADLRGAFTRNGPLSPDLLVTLLLHMTGDANRRGYELALHSFWDQCRSFGIALPTEKPVSGAAFCMARKKLPAGIILNLVQLAADQFDKLHARRMRWCKGRRVFGIDGTKINLQRSPELFASFAPPKGANTPQILVSTLFDLISKVPHNVGLGSIRKSERDLLLAHLDRLSPGDVIVLDRGYPSYPLFALLRDLKIDFVIRVPNTSTFKAVAGFVASGKADEWITIVPSRAQPMRHKGPVEVRALRVKVPGGKPTILLTSLPSEDFTRKQIGDLYRMRWNIEEYYKLTKSAYLGPGQFHAKSPEGVRQEVNALALYVALTRLLMAEVSEKLGVPYERVGQKSSVLAVSEYLTRILLTSDPERAVECLDQLLERMTWARASPRPGRRSPRRSYKPHPKWGARGRIGG